MTRLLRSDSIDQPTGRIPKLVLARTRRSRYETLLHGADDMRRFFTHNDLQYYDKNPTGKHREGRVIGAVQPHVEDGYTKSEKLHQLGTGQKWDPSDQLRNQNPYQAKSVKARDTFFDDHSEATTDALRVQSQLHRGQGRIPQTATHAALGSRTVRSGIVNNLTSL